MANEPTQKQVKEFWEWCGFRQLQWANIGWHYEQTKKVMNWTHDLLEYGSLDFLPRIDLNNLFKYEPITEKGYRIELIRYKRKADDVINAGNIAIIKDGAGEIVAMWVKETLEDALFWALWQVKNKGG